MQLGDTCRDIISGFTGTAVARTQWLYGCDRITLQPPVDKDGKLPDNSSFDIMQIEVVQKAKKPTVAKKVKTGGPQREKSIVRR